MWLQHMSGLLAASVVVCHAIEKNGRPVLVHCSDGWDRTPQIVATAQLCLDPFYRTVDGFRILVEREWLSFGHKFADRLGHGPGSDELNERCPVFLQWLDCVHQIHRQFPCSFEFSMGYLIKLAQHSHSGLFGTFLCNTVRERIENTIGDRTFSVWPFLSGPIYKNPLYIPNRERVLWPAHNLRDLTVWSEVYLCSLGNNQNSVDPTTTGEMTAVPKAGESTSPMIKTRSYGDLVSGFNPNGLTRRSSDPNMPVESNMLTPLNISQENSIDSSISPPVERQNDVVADPSPNTQITEFRKKFEDLTQEIFQSDEEFDGGGSGSTACRKITPSPDPVDNASRCNGNAQTHEPLEQEKTQFYTHAIDDGAVTNSTATVGYDCDKGNGGLNVTTTNDVDVVVNGVGNGHASMLDTSNDVVDGGGMGAETREIVGDKMLESIDLNGEFWVLFESAGKICSLIFGIKESGVS
jgi:myotubularin-related protein 3/4